MKPILLPHLGTLSENGGFLSCHEQNSSELRIKCTMHVCTHAFGNTVVIASGKPLSPSTTEIRMSDRIWAWNATKAPEGSALFIQNQGPKLVYSVGHELAMFHKPGIIAAAYTGDPEGLYEIGFDKTFRCVSPGPCWHCNISRNGRWAIIDARIPGGNMCDIIAINFATGARETLYTTTQSATGHPYHPHPHISPDNKWVVFNDAKQQRVLALEIDQ
jgi:hypothetical protein